MAGFVRARPTFKLVFEDPEFEGLEVRLQSVSLGGFIDLARLMDIRNVTTDNLDEVRPLFEEFARALISWNLEEPGPDGEPVPVPATLDGIYGQDLDFVLLLVDTWFDQLAGAAPPLQETSPDGQPSLAGSIPMEPLPANQAS